MAQNNIMRPQAHNEITKRSYNTTSFIIICGIIILQVIIMNRVFLKLGPITIYWYALLIVLSICIGIYFSTKEAKRMAWEEIS